MKSSTELSPPNAFTRVRRTVLKIVNTCVDIAAAYAYDAGMLSARDRALDAVFTALANRHRREIIARLADGPMTTPEVGRHFGFTKQALSRHVDVLEGAGLIKTTVRGRVHHLSLAPAPLDGIERWVVQLRNGWARSLERLDAVMRDE